MKGIQLTESQIKKLIVVRLFKLQGGGAYKDYVWHHIGVIRGLLWALTGRDQGDLHRPADILSIIDVPFIENPMNSEVTVDQKWLEDNKLKV